MRHRGLRLIGRRVLAGGRRDDARRRARRGQPALRVGLPGRDPAGKRISISNLRDSPTTVHVEYAGKCVAFRVARRTGRRPRDQPLAVAASAQTVGGFGKLLARQSAEAGHFPFLAAERPEHHDDPDDDESQVTPASRAGATNSASSQKTLPEDDPDDFDPDAEHDARSRRNKTDCMAQKRTNWLRFSRKRKTIPPINMNRTATPAATFGGSP